MAEPTFDERVADRFDLMSRAEQRVARFFQEHREEVLIASAVALAAKTETSDATIVRTSKALGFSGLDDLRRRLAEELRHSISPAERLTRTLDEVGDSLSAALALTLQIHRQSLESLERSLSADRFEKAVQMITAASRIMVFGLGPSSAIAAYLAIQLARFGLDTGSLANAGFLLADDLQRLRKGDLLIILAYGRVYPELAVVVEEAQKRQIHSLLLTDTLAAKLRNKVDLILSVPRGRAEMLSMHTATLGLVEALLVGAATQRPAATFAHLDELNALRQRLAGASAGLPLPEKASGSSAVRRG